MSKRIILLFLAITTFTVCHAQVFDFYDSEDKTHYSSIGYASSTLSQDGAPSLRSSYGISLNLGRTFRLHYYPIWNCLYFGVDVTALDLTYTNYRIKHITYWETDRYQYHQADISMHLGPSFSFCTYGPFSFNGYFRYAPSLSLLKKKEGMSIGYGSFHVGGVSVAYGSLGLGFEVRLGKCRYNERNTGLKSNADCNGWRTYITIRF